MRFRYTGEGAKLQVKTTTERLKVLKVIGEKVGQLVVEADIAVDAVKIDRVQAELREVTDHLFPGKVVKQGIVHSEIIYVGPEHALKYISEDTPFLLTVDISDFVPNSFSDVQNHVLDITPGYTLLPPHCAEDLAILQLKIVAHILVKVSEWIQLDVVTQVDVFPRHH